MPIKKRITSNKPMVFLCIMILCLMTGIDDISGFWQPLNISVPMIQSGNDQDDGEGHVANSLYNLSTWRDAIDAAQQLSFSQVYLGEIKKHVNLIYLSSSHNRAPPSFS